MNSLLEKNRSLDFSNNLVNLTVNGYPKLAADTILNQTVCGKLNLVIGSAIQRLYIEFIRNKESRENIYEALIEITMNLIGIEREKTGFSEKDAKSALLKIVNILEKMEETEREDKEKVAHRVIQKLLGEMKSVMMGNSLVSKIAELIEEGIDEDNLMKSFICSAEIVLKENVYYHIVTKKLSKFGNDSATGFRWVRHLGFVQVSSNPVIAARAFEEFPSLWDKFKKIILEHPEWCSDPEKHSDEIAMHGTIVSLLPNLIVFRPLFLLTDFQDGLVSYQINPYKAASLEKTLDDAIKVYSILEKSLENIDPYLWNENLEGLGRPNVVYKIAGCDPSAVDITFTLNKMGIGTNNTVTYTVSQEVYLILAEIKGMVEAIKAGIPVTQVYETNMIGRLEDHLREVIAEKLLTAALAMTSEKEKYISKLAEQMNVVEEVEKSDSYKDKISILCSRKYLECYPPKTVLLNLTDKRFSNILKELYGDSKDIESQLTKLEEDIHYSGVYVTRRIYSIFFSHENRRKWIDYIQAEYNITREDAEIILNKIDILPSSKRRANDTLYVLGNNELSNLTNTEFPSQQLEVWKTSMQKGFNLSDFEASIAWKIDEERIERLLQLKDFRKAYELTPFLLKTFRKVGIEEDYGSGGIQPEEWPNYGPVIKTLKEFKGAYLNYRVKATEFVEKVARENKKIS